MGREVRRWRLSHCRLALELSLARLELELERHSVRKTAQETGFEPRIVVGTATIALDSGEGEKAV